MTVTLPWYPLSVRLIVAGSRWIPEGVALLIVNRVVELYRLRPAVILCGKARGPDTAGELWAKQRGVAVDYFPALWTQFKNGAGPERNERMAVAGTHLLALWDGRSTGTADMIARARARYPADHVLVLEVVPSPVTQARLDVARKANDAARRKAKSQRDLALPVPSA